MTAISTNKRILAKCFTYRVSSIIMSMITIRIVTGSFKGALAFGFLDFFMKTGFQFGHEKMWKMTDWGKIYK